jgi:carboxymethylenebutenolidase
MFPRFAVIALFASLAGLACSAHAQDWAIKQLDESPRHGEWVVLEHGDRKVDAFVVFPEVAEPAMAVVVIHEIFGLTDWVRTVCDELAAAGYVAIAPDLLSEAGPDGGNSSSFESRDARVQAIRDLSPDQITADLNAAVDHVLALPSVNGRVAVCGFCWGGSQTFNFACASDRLVAAFPFYGSASNDPDQLGRITCPVYGFFAENDARVNSTLPETVELMKAAGKTFEMVEYAGGGHGFMRAGQEPEASAGNSQARAEAWVRFRKLLGEVAMATAETEADKAGGLDFKVTDIQGNPVQLSDYHGQVLLVVNVASKCGMTPQYKQLQELYAKYGDRGLVVLGFPCNQFLGQEPGTDEEIATFCTTTYNVTFPMFSKIEVKGDNQAPLYAWLTGLELAPVGSGEISWNFEKFLIGRDGQPIARFGPRTKPDHKDVVAAIEAALGAEGN